MRLLKESPLPRKWGQTMATHPGTVTIITRPTYINRNYRTVEPSKLYSSYDYNTDEMRDFLNVKAKKKKNNNDNDNNNDNKCLVHVA